MGDEPKTFDAWADATFGKQNVNVMWSEDVANMRMSWNASRAALKAEVLGVLRELGTEAYGGMMDARIKEAIACIEKL